MKIVTVIGARPQFIKAAVVHKALTDKDVEEIIIHTGQHYDTNMSDVFFEEMDIPKPYCNLDINGLSHGAMTGQMLERIEHLLMEQNPDWVLVYGDTNSTLAAALAAQKLHIRIAHVEAGLRSFNLKMPEEINRILTDRMSDVLFCPTDKAVENLMFEGYANMPCKIEKSGDVMQDAAIFYASKAQKPDINVPKNFVLCTVHRAENTDNPKNLNNIFQALEIISKTMPILVPLHPRTKSKLVGMNYDFKHTDICFIEPVGYLDMVYLLKNCLIVMTDSGGLQKEAYFFGKNCVTLREETEWVELVDNGFNILTGADIQRIVNAFQQMSANKQKIEPILYGKGDAGKKIVDVLLSY